MFRSFGAWEIALILVIILIIFGVGKLPQVGGAVGKAMRSFKKAQTGEDEKEEKAEAKKPEEDKTEKS
jgi:sec-independent protein translocase protein TatA